MLTSRRALLNGGGKLSYFERRGIREETVRKAYVGYENGAFAYPTVAKGGGLLGVHFKSEARNAKGKRSQWWGSFADVLPPKGRGKKPGDPAKIIPFGLETLGGLEPGSLALLCCGEEDALSLRQAGYTALSQPGAGLLEPAYAEEFAGLEVVVFYDAGEERQARKDALKLERAGAAEVREVRWPPDAPNGSDVNGRLVDDPGGFEAWAEQMITGAEPAVSATPTASTREGAPDSYAAVVPGLRVWPILGEEALCGLPGKIVGIIEPHTEADPAAVLVNLLVGFGNAAGRGAHVRVGPDRHGLNLNAVLVGETAKGRKGTSWGFARDLLHAADPFWVEDRILGGLSSGEGLIYAVRDRVVSEGQDGELMVRDEGAPDKRLLAIEGEFAGVLKTMTREGNTLSAIIRQAWDGGRLQTLTRNSPLKATDPHVSVIGHVTKGEVLRHLSENDTSNGFANRFLWLVVKRSRVLPFGGGWSKVDTAPIVARLTEALGFARRANEITWGESAEELWVEVYESLSEGEPGLFGAATGRAEAQVLRLAAIYAAMDLSGTIEADHLRAGLALWGYAEDSAWYVFGNATGDPVADRIMDAANAATNGLSRTEIRALFSGHKSSARIDQSLANLEKLGRLRCEMQHTGGRPVERWMAR